MPFQLLGSTSTQIEITITVKIFEISPSLAHFFFERRWLRAASVQGEVPLKFQPGDRHIPRIWARRGGGGYLEKLSLVRQKFVSVVH